MGDMLLTVLFLNSATKPSLPQQPHTEPAWVSAARVPVNFLFVVTILPWKFFFRASHSGDTLAQMTFNPADHVLGLQHRLLLELYRCLILIFFHLSIDR